MVPAALSLYSEKLKVKGDKYGACGAKFIKSKVKGER